MVQKLLGYEWLGGSLFVEKGGIGDYERLARFHYAAKKPAVVAGVWVVRWREQASQSEECRMKSEERGRVVAAAVLSFATPRCLAREQCFGLRVEGRYGGHIRWLNSNLRTISRVVVHPQFRGVGIAARLVREVCEEAGVKYVEAIAAMGKVHPFFEKGGMRKISCEDEKAYFVFENPKFES